MKNHLNSISSLLPRTRMLNTIAAERRQVTWINQNAADTAKCRILEVEEVVPMSSATARLEARISTDLHALLRRAAELQGRSMTDFISEALRKEARQVVDDATLLRISPEDQTRFVSALLNPPEPNAALKRAMARRAQLVAE
ncbi:MAG: hypothetical protein H6Q00_925 [Holophagaceae bacterium]|nr:hypothetical protein [Holophagaceae bacterium]